MNDILSAIYRNLLESRFSASLSCPDYRRAIIRVEQCMDELRQALPAEEQELPEQDGQIDTLLRRRLRSDTPGRDELRRASDYLYRRGFGRDEIRAAIARYQDNYEEY